MVIKNDSYQDLNGLPIGAGDGNLIINGDFESWQEGNQTSIVNGGFFADMWQYGKTGTMVHDVSEAYLANAPSVAQSNHLSSSTLLVDCTTLDAALGAGDYAVVIQKIEGYRFAAIAQKTFTLSFWHNHTKTGTYCVGFNNSASDRSYVAEYTQSVADTWEKAEITVTASPSAGTWDYINGVGLTVIWTIAAAVGSTYETTADAWQTGYYFNTLNQVNACDSASNNFRLAQVKVEPGSVATQFQGRGLGEELALIGRYFETSYNTGVDIGSASELGMLNNYHNAASTAAGVVAQFKVMKRAIPAVTSYNPVNGNSGKLYDYSGAAEITATVDLIGHYAARIFGPYSSAAANIAAHFKADARL